MEGGAFLGETVHGFGKAQLGTVGKTFGVGFAAEAWAGTWRYSGIGRTGVICRGHRSGCIRAIGKGRVEVWVRGDGEKSGSG